MRKQKLLGVTVDENLKFKEPIRKLCKKAEQKLCALTRICNIFTQRCRKT